MSTESVRNYETVLGKGVSIYMSIFLFHQLFVFFETFISYCYNCIVNTCAHVHNAYYYYGYGCTYWIYDIIHLNQNCFLKLVGQLCQLVPRDQVALAPSRTMFLMYYLMNQIFQKVGKCRDRLCLGNCLIFIVHALMQVRYMLWLWPLSLSSLITLICVYRFS